MLPVPLLPVPYTLWVSILRTAFAEEVEDEKVTGFYGRYHFIARVLAPSLQHPFGLWVAILLHGAHDVLARFTDVQISGKVLGFVEGVYAVVGSLAIEPFRFFIEEAGIFVKTLVSWEYDPGARKAVPELQGRLGRLLAGQSVSFCVNRSFLPPHGLTGAHTAVAG